MEVNTGASTIGGGDSYLARQGWRVLRFWNPDVLANTEGVLEMIRLTLLEQQESMQPPSPSRR